MILHEFEHVVRGTPVLVYVTAYEPEDKLVEWEIRNLNGKPAVLLSQTLTAAEALNIQRAALQKMRWKE